MKNSNFWCNMFSLSCFTILTACNSGMAANTAATSTELAKQDSSLAPILAGQMILSDSYSCAELAKCSDGESGGLGCISAGAYQKCVALQSLNQGGVTLNDNNNAYVASFQGQPSGQNLQWPFYMNVSAPTTLFAAFTLVYGDDIAAPENEIGWPLPEPIQEDAYQAGNPSTCKSFVNNDFKSSSPWLSHCSAFAEFAESVIFDAHIPPTQDVSSASWCNLANRNNDGLNQGLNGWRKVSTTKVYAENNQESAVAAQILANRGCAVVASLKNSSGAGHIAVVLPNTWQSAQYLQTQPNYQTSIMINGVNSFVQFLSTFGPEEMQSGLYNFQHTDVYNGFFSELVHGINFTQIEYFYNPAECD